MTVVSYDAAYPAEGIPKEAGFYLSYEDFTPHKEKFGVSSFETMDSMFPKKVVPITSEKALRDCPVADCEKGALTVQQVADWAYDRFHSGAWSVVYNEANENSLRDLVLALKGRGLELANPDDWPKAGVYWWAARWSDNKDIPPTALGLQWEGSAPDRAYDSSVWRVNLLDGFPKQEVAVKDSPKVNPPDPYVSVTLPRIAQETNAPARQSVRSLQAIIVDRNLAKIVVDGRYGSSTATAVRNIQRVFGLPENGIVDGATWQIIVDGTKGIVPAKQGPPV